MGGEIVTIFFLFITKLPKAFKDLSNEIINGNYNNTNNIGKMNFHVRGEKCEVRKRDKSDIKMGESGP